MANSRIVTLRMVERMDSSLPIGRLLACPACGRARQGCWSGLCLPADRPNAGFPHWRSLVVWDWCSQYANRRSRPRKGESEALRPAKW